MNRKSPKLPLTDKERSNLRKGKVRLRDILDFSPEHLGEILDIPLERARYLVAMSVFQ
ncbi:hypothetical protein [Bacillus sp. NTK074B]|uniref:hypothetical protein n=1 Tax=Bacillus sp. NTK074B TaxID=2802174 RepID=UPI0027B9BAF2